MSEYDMTDRFIKHHAPRVLAGLGTMVLAIVAELFFAAMMIYWWLQSGMGGWNRSKLFRSCHSVDCWCHLLCSSDRPWETHKSAFDLRDRATCYSISFFNLAILVCDSLSFCCVSVFQTKEAKATKKDLRAEPESA